MSCLNLGTNNVGQNNGTKCSFVKLTVLFVERSDNTMVTCCNILFSAALVSDNDQPKAKLQTVSAAMVGTKHHDVDGGSQLNHVQDLEYSFATPRKLNKQSTAHLSWTHWNKISLFCHNFESATTFQQVEISEIHANTSYRHRSPYTLFFLCAYS